MTDKPEESARRIAEQGRDALLARLRPAFAEAVSAHADVLSLDSDQVEQMVQRAADRADGLQWRRALASIATQELGVSLGEALSHPVVERAQEIVGAPSYEESLAKLGISAPTQGPSQSDGQEPATQPAEEAEAAPESEIEAASEPEVEAAPAPQAEAAPESVATDPGQPDPAPEPTREGDPEPLRLAATHLGGIATLQTGEEGLELHVGAAGLDIARTPGRVLGRLRWREINALEVTPPKGLRRRRRPDRANLVVRTEHGDATFEVPAVSEDELRANIAPLVEHYGQR